MRRPFDPPRVQKKENDSSEHEDKATSLHILHLAKQIGIPIDELKQLTMGELMSLIELYTQSHQPKEETKVREATQADMDALLS